MLYKFAGKLTSKAVLGIGAAALAALTLTARPAGAVTPAPTSFGTAQSFDVNGNFGSAQGLGQIGQTYYYDFLDLQSSSVTLGFNLNNLAPEATGPLALYNAAGALMTAGTFGSYVLTPGLYYVAFDETTLGYNQQLRQPTSNYDLSLAATLLPSTLPFRLAARNTGALIAAVPVGYVPATITPNVAAAVPEGSDLALLALGLLPVGAVAFRRRSARV